MTQILPLIFGADVLRLKDEIGFLERESMAILHVDIMGGNLISNIAFGPNQIGAMKKTSRTMSDMYMMIDHPKDHLGDVVVTGIEMISVHYKSTPHAHDTIQHIKKAGKKTGVVSNPGTPESVLEHLPGDIDYILIVTINPGTPGQTSIEKSLEKITNPKKMIDSRPIRIEVDGGVNDATTKQVAGAGAELIVVGGYLFGGNPDKRYSILWETVKQKLRRDYGTISVTPQEQRGQYKDEKI